MKKLLVGVLLAFLSTSGGCSRSIPNPETKTWLVVQTQRGYVRTEMLKGQHKMDPFNKDAEWITIWMRPVDDISNTYITIAHPDYTQEIGTTPVHEPATRQLKRYLKIQPGDHLIFKSKDDDHPSDRLGGNSMFKNLRLVSVVPKEPHLPRMPQGGE